MTSSAKWQEWIDSLGPDGYDGYNKAQWQDYLNQYMNQQPDQETHPTNDAQQEPPSETQTPADGQATHTDPNPDTGGTIQTAQPHEDMALYENALSAAIQQDQ